MDIVNESGNHSRGEESHYNLLVVSDEFKGKLPIDKQRLIYGILKEEMKRIHALTLSCKTLEEWEKEQSGAESPGCVNKRQNQSPKNTP